MHTLHVELADRRYPIYIGSALLGHSELFKRHITGRQVLVVSNTTVAPLYLERCLAALSDYQCESVILPDGEQHKTLEVLNTIYTALLEKRCDRGVTIVALGGGVVGDMAGFAAACYQRGVPFIQVPTTLLAQVDSSVGGKTAVNHPLGKNMIGAFYQPRCVIADTQTLDTLPDRELSAGIAEVIKYGLISDALFFVWLEQNMARLLARDPQALAYAIERSCRNKAGIVAADETEQGQRALLNLGHTFGHAIETGMGYGTWLHGEAVAVGMVMAAVMSQRLGWLQASVVERLQALLQRAHLPITGPVGLSPEQFLEHMAVDKKVLSGKLRLVLLQGLGEAVVTSDFDAALLPQVIASCSD